MGEGLWRHPCLLRKGGEGQSQLKQRGGQQWRWRGAGRHHDAAVALRLALPPFASAANSGDNRGAGPQGREQREGRLDEVRDDEPEPLVGARWRGGAAPLQVEQGVVGDGQLLEQKGVLVGRRPLDVVKRLQQLLHGHVQPANLIRELLHPAGEPLVGLVQPGQLTAHPHTPLAAAVLQPLSPLVSSHDRPLLLMLQRTHSPWGRRVLVVDD
mmetsp:Transcript_38054/g.108660  ORF Transcript_38054/g.108660 Transcript_38054/m.108660 type:complete len:212 (-) Transcript_38054:111-746(-)